MYESSQTLSAVSSGAVLGSVVALPNTEADSLGSYIAVFAITLGVIALTSQLVVRIAKRRINS